MAVFLFAACGTVAAAGCSPESASRGAAESSAEAQPIMGENRSAQSTTNFVPVPRPAPTAFATFGGGCFWCVEAVFEHTPGVVAVTSGYAGGSTVNPTYEQVCTGRTGHAEVVRVEYDPLAVGYDKLLEVFFSSHDPTTPNRQGPDVGTQYRSIILTHDAAQARAAKEYIDRLNRENAFDAPVVTQVAPLERFYAAEPEHQDYYRNNPNKSYCRVMIAPKLKKLGLK